MGRAAKLRTLKTAVVPVPADPVRLDFGCGPNKRPGFLGVDATPFPHVDFVVDLTKTPWPWADNSVAEAHASHFVEHLTAMQRVAFFNELYRVLVPNGSCQIITPHWASCRAYGDPTHQWPPVSEFLWYYLSRDWRAGNAPHTDAQYLPGGFDCHFEVTWGYTMRADLQIRNAEFQQFAMANHKEAITDMVATLKALK
jgi:hypothetical protein